MTVRSLQKIKFDEATQLRRTDVKLIENGDQPLKGMLFYILYTVMYSSSFLCAVALYNRNPDLTSFQLLIGRSGFALSIQLVVLNVNLKSAVWDGISRDSVSPLIFRTLQGTCT